MQLTKKELIETAYEMTAGPLESLTADQVRRLMTVTQYVTDICLNELEARDELTIHPDHWCIILPYESEHMVETILTRA